MVDPLGTSFQPAREGCLRRYMGRLPSAMPFQLLGQALYGTVTNIGQTLNPESKLTDVSL
jgi:hypothetical protein